LGGFAAVSEASRRAKFFAPMARYNQLGLLLPTEENLDTNNAAAVAEAKAVLAEMAKIKVEMDALGRLA
jgi:hypothetical protein